MGFWGKLGCAIGIHDWSEWRYVTAGKCDQTRSCRRDGCSKVESQVEHSWGAWVHSGPGKCDQKRSCSRCSKDDFRTDHLWDVWHYESPTSCVQVRFCRRCEAGVEHKRPQSVRDHQLSPEDVPKVTCRLRTGTCPRCGQTVNIPLSPAEHEWGPWQGSSGNRKRTCRLCHQTDYSG